MYISPNLKPTRGFFYATATCIIGLGGYVLLHDWSEFWLWFLMSGFIYLAIGAVVIHSQDLRDEIFGLTPCPWCNKNVISIKDKLKAKVDGKNYAKCQSCKKKIALHWLAVTPFVLSVFLSLIGLAVFESSAGMYIAAWFLILAYMVYFGRRVNVIKN